MRQTHINVHILLTFYTLRGNFKGTDFKNICSTWGNNMVQRSLRSVGTVL